MNFQEYRKYTPVTMVNLGPQVYNSVHMSLGMATEILDELFSAFDKAEEENALVTDSNSLSSLDMVNIGEELGDAQWYISNYLNIWEIEHRDVLVPQERNEFGEVVKDMMIAIGRLQDYDKKLLAYNKSVDVDLRKETVYDILTATEYIASLLEIDMNKVRENNIAKLKSRYGDKFSEYFAINRDLEKEREILSK